MKVEVFAADLDSLSSQFEDHFQENSLKMVEKLIDFFHEGVLKIAENLDKSRVLHPLEIKQLCEDYYLDCEAITSEI